MQIFKDFTFDSAHFLPNVPEGHKCRQTHGHTYRLRVYLEGKPMAHYGWVMDFGDIKKVVEPLIRSYLFVRITERDYSNVLQVPGVVKFISFSDKPITIPDYQIDIMKRLLADGTDVEVSSENFEPGDPIEIVAGKLMGLTGELIESKGHKKVIIRIDQLDRSLLINISSGFIRKRELVEVN